MTTSYASRTPPTTWPPFARDLGYDGEPFIWDEEERRHLRARLDALYFHLYGLLRDDAEYILDTFPIVRRKDEAAFGTYRTRDMTLAYMNALASRGYGDEGGGVDRPRCGSARSGSASSDNPLGAALKFGRMQPSLANTGPACRMAGVRGCGRLF